MAYCPNISDKEVRKEFNRVVSLFDGEPLVIEEFKSKELRDKRIGKDKEAMDIAYKVWDLTNGENIPNNLSDIQSLILQKENQRDRLIETSSRLVIPELGATKQNQLIDMLSGDVLREIIKADTDTGLAPSVVLNKWKDLFNIKLSQFEGARDRFKVSGDIEKAAKLDLYAKEYQLILDKWDDLVRLTGSKIAKVNNLTSIGRDLELGESFEDTIADNAGWAEDNLSIDSKKTASVQVKRMLSNIRTIDRIEYDEDGKATPVVSKNYLGFEQIMDFDTVYNQLHQILVGLEPNMEILVTKMEQYYEQFPWLYDVVAQLNSSPQQYRNLFITDMTKHYVPMRFVMWSERNGKYSLEIYDSNNNAIVQSIKDKWNNGIKRSGYAIVDPKNEEEYILDPKVSNELIDKANAWAKEQPKPEELREWLEAIGITIQDKTLRDLTEGKFRHNGAYRSYKELFTNDNGLVRALAKTISAQGRTPLSTSTPLSDGVVKSLANLESIYNKTELSNSHRSGVKTIYSYSNNKYLINRHRELMNDSELLEKLSGLSFSKHSIFLSELYKDGKIDKEGTFYQNFDYAYVSLEPFKKKKSASRDNTELNKVSQAEHEIFKISMLTGEGTTQDLSGKNKKIVYMTYPTNSDKSTVTMLRVPELMENSDLQNNGEVSQKLLDKLYKYIVLPEIERINEFQDKVTNISGFEEGKNKFLMLPELNTIEGMFTDGSINLSALTDIDLTNPNSLRSKVNEVLKSYINNLVDDKLSFWNKNGIGAKNEKGYYDYLDHKFMSKIIGSKDTELRNAATYMVGNYLLFNSEVFKTFIGDPALFYKSRSNDAIEQSRDTFINIGKRLAGDIAPGSEGNFEKEEYIIAVLEDKAATSLMISQITNILDGKSFDLDKYKELDKADKRKYLSNFPKSKEYIGMDGTDAQEFTTWQEHLEVLRAFGKIKDKDYDEIQSKLKNNEVLEGDLFGIMMQPLKPVYVDNKIADGVDRRIYVKSSSFPLLPQLVGTTQLKKVADAMEKDKVDRVAFTTAVKLGGFTKPLDIWTDGGITDNIDFTGSTLTLNRKGFRIQQEVPYKEDKDKINVGTQERKLLFTNLLNVEGFDYEGEAHTGRELKKKYDSLWKEIYKTSYENLSNRLLDEDGKLNVEETKKVIEEEMSNRDYSIADLEMLGIDSDLKLLPYYNSAYKIESLLNSIVNNKIIKQKLPGLSYVLGTEEGFEVQKWEDFDATKHKGIVYTPTFDGKLKPQRIVDKSLYESTGEEKILTGAVLKKAQKEGTAKVLAAQAFVPMKFRDDKGNLLDASNYTTNGKIDFNKIPKEVLNIFSFRIPTQGLNSMSQVEIVGFLPKESGDLFIATRDYIAQMGSDFDVDKIYTYQYNTQFKDGKLSKYKYDDKAVEELFYKVNKMDKASSDFISALLGDKAEDYLNIDLENFKKKFKAKEYQNKILDIHFSVLSNPIQAVQEQILRPLGFWKLPDVANNVTKWREDRGIRGGKTFTGLSDDYQRQKYVNATKGQMGVGMFSLDSVFNAISQDKNLNMFTSKDKEELIRVVFGEVTSNGELSKEKTINNESYKQEVIEGYQSAAVDNEKEQLMDKLNINDETFGVIRILNQLGFTEEVPYFISQDIIFDYVEELERIRSGLGNYVADAPGEAYKRTIAKYGNLQEVRSSLAADKLDISTMKKLIELGENAPDYNETQIAILDKFNTLQEYGKSLQTIQSTINVDSKGLGKNLLETILKQEQVDSLSDSSVSNAEKLLWEINDKGELINMTVNGLAIHYGLKFNNRLWKNKFPYSRESVQNIFKEIESVTNRSDRGLSSKADFRQKIWKGMKSYLFTQQDLGLTSQEVSSARNKLFFDTDSNKSLSSILYELSDSKYFKNNAFLNKLEFTIEKNGKPSLIKYKASSGENLDETRVYTGFLDLLINPKQIDLGNGYTPSKLGEDLITYSFLSGGIQEAIQFVRYIPPQYLDSIPFFNKLKNTNYDNNEVFGFNSNENKNYWEVSKFTKQYIQHNPTISPKVNLAKKTNIEVNGVDRVMWSVDGANVDHNSDVPPTAESLKQFTLNDIDLHIEMNGLESRVPPPFLTIYEGGKNSLYQYAGNNLYNRIDTLGILGMSEFKNDMSDQQSAISFNKANADKVIENKKLPSTEKDRTLKNPTVVNEYNPNDLLNEVIEKTKNPYTKELASKLFESMDKMHPDIKKVLKVKLDKTLPAAGRYRNGIITLNPNKVVHATSEDLFKTYLHELMHAFTSGQIGVYNKLKEQGLSDTQIKKKLGTEVVKAIKTLEGDFDRLIDYITKNPELNSVLDEVKRRVESKDNLEETRVVYGATKLKEYVAELFTNEAFQKVLNEIPYKGGQSWYSKIVDSITKVLKSMGLNVDKNSLLRASMDNVFSLIEADREYVPESVFDGKQEIANNTLTTKYELFPGVFTNSQQTVALDKLEAFINSSREFFVLSGKGGTGKTTIIKKLLDLTNENRIIGIAPTHAAVKQLNKSIDNSKTLASSLAIKLNENTGNFEPDLYARKKGNVPIKGKKLIIIDETSMVSDKLLREIKELKDPGAKVIFMGDHHQLPPINSSKNSSTFDVSTEEDFVVLSERMRQGETSPIVPITDKVADNIDDESTALRAIDVRESAFNERTNEGVVFEDNENTAIDEFVKDLLQERNNPNYTKAITYNNQDNNSSQSVKNLNRKIRDKLWGKDVKNQFNKGEVVTAYATYLKDGDPQQPLMHNSESYIVLDKVPTTLSKTIEVYSRAKGVRNLTYSYEGYNLTLQEDDGNVITIPVIADSDKVEYMYNLSKLWKSDTQLGLKLQSEFGNIEYGYAITSHKAQGATYRNAYVFEDNILGSSNAANVLAKNQSLYVAVSRPSHKLVVVSNKNKINSNNGNLTSVEPNLKSQAKHSNKGIFKRASVNLGAIEENLTATDYSPINYNQLHVAMLKEFGMWNDKTNTSKRLIVSDASYKKMLATAQRINKQYPNYKATVTRASGEKANKDYYIIKINDRYRSLNNVSDVEVQDKIDSCK